MNEMMGREQPIPVLSNVSICEFKDAGLIEIAPFSEKRLAATAYHLNPYLIRYKKMDLSGELQGGTLSLEDNPYALQSGEHVVVSIREKIILAPGVIGNFFPASACIESGLVLTAGRLDANYKHAIVLGVFNASNDEVLLTPEYQLSRISFSWLGVDNIPDYNLVPEPGLYIDAVDKIRKPEA